MPEKIKLYVMVKSGDGLKYLFVDVFTEKEFDDLGAYGCEQIAKRFAHNGGFEYVDIAT